MLLCMANKFLYYVLTTWKKQNIAQWILQCVLHQPRDATEDASHDILTWRPLPFEAWRLQRPRLPFGVVPQLLMICSCFSARSARSSSSSMNCCSRTLALASRAAVSWRNWSIWATSLRAERGTAILKGQSLNSAYLETGLTGGQTTDMLNLTCGENTYMELRWLCIKPMILMWLCDCRTFSYKPLSHSYQLLSCPFCMETTHTESWWQR